jgi:hypothetical protein
MGTASPNRNSRRRVQERPAAIDTERNAPRISPSTARTPSGFRLNYLAGPSFVEMRNSRVIVAQDRVPQLWRYLTRDGLATRLEYRLVSPKSFGLVAFGGIGEFMPAGGQLLQRVQSSHFLPRSRSSSIVGGAPTEKKNSVFSRYAVKSPVSVRARE